MKRFIFLLTMMLSFGIASMSATQDENVCHNVSIETVQVTTMDVQAFNVAFEPVQTDLATYSFEYVVMNVSLYIVEFNDAGLKPSETLIPTKKITSLNYHAGNYNYLKHRYRCSDLRCSFGLHT